MSIWDVSEATITLKMWRSIVRNIRYYCEHLFFLPFDIVVSLGLIVCAWPIIIVVRRISISSERIAIIRIIEGGNLESIYQKYGNLDNYFLHTIPGFTRLVIGAIFKAKNKFQLRLKSDYLLTETPYWSTFRFASFVRFLLIHLFLMKRHDVSIIHTNSPYFIGLVGACLAKLSGLPLCISIHANYEKSEFIQGRVIPRIFGSLALSRIIERWTYQRADRVLPIRYSMISDLVKKGCPQEKIRLFPHGIAAPIDRSDQAIELLKRLDVESKKPLVSTAARLEKENYCWDLFEIALRLVHDTDVSVVIAGNGSELRHMRIRLNESGLEDRIKVPGAVSHEEVIGLRQLSTVNLCLMGGFSLLESVMSGNPVVAYDVEWHSELISNGSNGFLVREGDIQSVVERVKYLLINNAYRETMGRRGKETVLRQYSLEKTNERKVEIYRELLNERK